MHFNASPGETRGSDLTTLIVANSWPAPHSCRVSLGNGSTTRRIRRRQQFLPVTAVSYVRVSIVSASLRKPCLQVCYSRVEYGVCVSKLSTAVYPTLVHVRYGKSWRYTFLTSSSRAHAALPIAFVQAIFIGS